MFTPQTPMDYFTMQFNIKLAENLTYVFGNDTCDKFWIPLRKIGSDDERKWVNDSGVMASFLPFSPGEPNGGRFQRCLASRLNNGTFTYFDQDCQRDSACSLCMIPQV